MTVIFEYIKELLKCGRYGKVIHLIKSNVHIWSLDDYHKVYYLCCGLLCDIKVQKFPLTSKQNILNKELFSDACIEYFAEFMQNNIYEYIHENVSKCTICGFDMMNLMVYTYDALRMYKKIELYKNLHDMGHYYNIDRDGDIVKFCIQKGIYIDAPSLFVHDEYITHYINKFRHAIPPIHHLIKYYINEEYDKANKLCYNTKLIMKGAVVELLNILHQPHINDYTIKYDLCESIDIITKYRHILKYLQHDDINDVLDHIGYVDIDDVIVICQWYEKKNICTKLYQYRKLKSEYSNILSKCGVLTDDIRTNIMSHLDNDLRSITEILAEVDKISYYKNMFCVIDRYIET